MREIKSAGLWKNRVLEFDTLPSTNEWALDNISSCRHGDVVLALDQTQGRGRFERRWLSSPGKCLTFSVVLTPGNPDNILFSAASMAAAVAVRDALRDLGVEALLKWPNDVVTARGKIAGVLCETEMESYGLIMGIGLNIGLTEPELAQHTFLQPATSIFMETRQSLPARDVLPVLLERLEHVIDIVNVEGLPFLLRQWSEYDTLKGKHITLQTAEGQSISGICAGLEADGRLRLVCDTGEPQSFWSGDVSLKKQ